ncbi:MAG: response regulator [Candidatus Bathyarchaeota archaeon]|nr:response regulator [Candidatus Bathyarchaeota archaeon]
MSLKEKIDVLDFLISILKEHEESLYEITQRLEKLSERLESGEMKPEDKRLIEETKKEVEEATSGKSSILIVDDDEFLTETFKVILETVGYQVEVAATGMQAIHKTKNKTYDLVILDIKLPDINGDEVARIMKKQGKKTKVVMITGYEKLAEGLKDEPVDVKEVLMKPVSPNNLLTVTKKVLEDNK